MQYTEMVLICLLVAAVLGGVIYAIYSNRQKKAQAEAQQYLKDRERQQELRRLKEKSDRARAADIANRKRKADELLKFREEYFPTSAADEELEKLWSECWEKDIHDEETQFNRQKRAIYQSRPIAIDTHSRRGLFCGSVGSSTSDINSIYQTDLSSCTCPDFRERRKPCKHIYSLFRTLDEKSDISPNLINVDSNLIDAFLSMDGEAQIKFLSFVRFHGGSSNRTMIFDDTLSPLIEAGFLTKERPKNYQLLLEEKTKDEILLALTKRGVTGFYASWSKVKLMAWICEGQSDFLEREFKQYAYISVAESVKEWADGISHSLLNYKIVLPDF